MKIKRSQQKYSFCQSGEGGVMGDLETAEQNCRISINLITGIISPPYLNYTSVA